jgi:hypothetical protein
VADEAHTLSDVTDTTGLTRDEARSGAFFSHSATDALCNTVRFLTGPEAVGGLLGGWFSACAVTTMAPNTARAVTVILN